jgi:hypothetical protein
MITFVADKSRVLTILEDFGVVRIENFVELVRDYDRENRRLRSWLRGESRAMVVVQALANMPEGRFFCV